MATQSAAPPGGGGNEQPKGEGPELSLVGGSARSEATSEFEQKAPFIIAEPIREDQVQNAVKFLSHPKVRGSPVMYRRSFLERKGLTKEEIDEAFRRVPDPPPNVTGADTVGTTQGTTQHRTSTSLQPQAPIQSPQPPAAQVGSVSLAPISLQPRFNWYNALIAIGVLSASGAGTAVSIKKVILPRLKGWIKRVAAEDNVSVNEEKPSKSLAEETAEAAKAAASAAAIVATASQELLNSKNEDRKYFEAFMGIMDVQVKEMKSMSEAIHKLERARGQDKLIEDYVYSATTNGTSNNSWRTSEANQIDAVRNTIKANGTPTAHYGPGMQSLAPASVEPMTAPHSKSYMEIMALVQRGEKPQNIREINDMPPNPNQAPSKPLVPPRTKPWEFAQQSAESQENGQSHDAPSEPWWRKKSVKITEIESEGEEGSLRQFPYSGLSDRPSTQRTWVPPQPPCVSIPEAAAAIRHPKPSPPIQKQYSDDEKMIVGSNESIIAAGTSNSAGEMDTSGGTAAGFYHSEIKEDRTDGIEAN